MIDRSFPNIISNDLPGTKKWFEGLLDWDTEFCSDWFVHLKATDNPAIELGIIAAGHDIVPAGVGAGVGGMLSFVVEDVDAVHQLATDQGATIIEPPTNLFYGQRRLVLQDPNGTFLDISSECPPSQEFLDSLPHLSEH